jgi:hypothetical protein
MMCERYWWTETDRVVNLAKVRLQLDALLSNVSFCIPVQTVQCICTFLTVREVICGSVREAITHHTVSAISNGEI